MIKQSYCKQFNLACHLFVLSLNVKQFICTQLIGSKYRNETPIIQFRHAVKGFQVLLFNTNNSISFVRTQLNGTEYYDNRLIGLVGRVFANGPEDLVSIPGRVIPKTSKMVLDTSLLNTQQYMVYIKSKVELSRERSSAFSNTSV